MAHLFKSAIIISLVCHSICFIIIGFSLPDTYSRHYEVRFLGSFLSKIDFLNSNISSKNIRQERNLMLDDFFIKKINVSFDNLYVGSKIKKPIITDKYLEKNIFLAKHKENDIINKYKLSSSLIYEPIKKQTLLSLNNNIPSNFMKVRLDIAKNGRVEFVQRLESTGSLESDLLIREHCLNYIFYPGFSKNPKIKKINLCELINVKN
ncbi:MAG: hypothetical protein AB1755_01130 [Candidatus Omnitrophota bacterium]